MYLTGEKGQGMRKRLVRGKRKGRCVQEKEKEWEYEQEAR